MTITTHALRHCITQQLQKAGVSSEAMLGVRPSAATTILDLASDDLTLDDKIHLERDLLKNLIEAFGPEPCFRINFRRIKTQRPLQRNPAPTSSSRRLGITLRRRAIPHVTHIIAVASGKGGVGKSTLACHLAMTLGRSLRVGLVDADIYGPSTPTMLGAKGPMPVTGHGRLLPIEAHGIKVVSFGFLTQGSLPVMWRGPLVASAIEQLCFDVDWGALDVLIVDLPPGTGDVQLTLVETLPISGALVITTPQDVALVDARKAVAMFERLDVALLGLVENMATFQCPHCHEETPIFNTHGHRELSLGEQHKVLLQLPLHQDLTKACDFGTNLPLEHPLQRRLDSLAEQVMARLQSTHPLGRDYDRHPPHNRPGASSS